MTLHSTVMFTEDNSWKLEQSHIMVNNISNAGNQELVVRLT